MSDTCVVNFANNWFVKGQCRLKETFRRHGYNGDFLLFNSEQELGCPPHSEAPYAFKAYALKLAQDKGYHYVLWVDSSVYAVKSVQLAFVRIERDGYLFLNGGWNTGQWCSDAALETLGITREDSFGYPHMMACVMGLDLHESTAQHFLQRYYELANDGVTFKGAWTNKNHEVSDDERVLGHRHDQTAASVIATKLGMKLTDNLLVYDETGDTQIPETAIFVLRHP